MCTGFDLGAAFGEPVAAAAVPVAVDGAVAVAADAGSAVAVLKKKKKYLNVENLSEIICIYMYLSLVLSSSRPLNPSSSYSSHGRRR